MKERKQNKMKIVGKKGLGNILKIILQICFWGGITFLITLPIILKRISIFEIMLYLNGITMLVIVKQFIGLFDSLKIEKPFCENTVKRMNTASIASGIMTVLFFIETIYKFTLDNSDIKINCILVFMTILFLGVAIALYILAELFRQATEYKSENDLTI